LTETDPCGSLAQGREPLVPEQPDEDPVPPLKVMRKRLNGVYRADTGFSGPTRRYVLIVALLVGLASIPTLAAITAGTNEIAGGGTDTMDIPFLPPASPGPIQSRPDSRTGASPLVLPPEVAEAIARAGRLLGEAGRRRPATKGDKQIIRYAAKRSAAKRSAASRKAGAGRPKARMNTGGSTETPSMGAFPVRSGTSHRPRKSAGGGDSLRPAHSSSPPRSHPSPTDVTDPSQLARSAFPDISDDDSSSQEYATYCSRSTASHRSSDRYEHRRRSVVSERPHNIRAASILEHSYAQGSLNRRRLIPESRADDNRGDGPYRGSHRAGSPHHIDDAPAQLRSSRVGRHHAEQTDDLSGRW
jgi:hypothetical protein